MAVEARMFGELVLDPLFFVGRLGAGNAVDVQSFGVPRPMVFGNFGNA